MCSARKTNNGDDFEAMCPDTDVSPGNPRSPTSKMAIEDESIRELYQVKCNEISQAFMETDVAYLKACALLPLELITTTSRFVINLPDQVESLAKSHIDALNKQGVTSYFRLVVSAALTAPDRMVGRHTTHLLRGATRVCPPYQSQTEWKLDGQTWRIFKIDASIRDSKLPIGVPDVVPGSASPFNF